MAKLRKRHIEYFQVGDVVQTYCNRYMDIKKFKPEMDSGPCQNCQTVIDTQVGGALRKAHPRIYKEMATN